MNSIWQETTDPLHFMPLKEKKNTDVLIIGGGIAGILCAYQLKNEGVDCILLEASEICGGITKNTTAKITLGHGLIYDKMIKRFGEKRRGFMRRHRSKPLKNTLVFAKISTATMKRRIITYIP